MPSYSIGIDPGAVNLGFAIVERDSDGKLSLVQSKTYNPSDHPFGEFPDVIRKTVLSSGLVSDTPWTFNMERYVSYADKMTQVTENILLVIGGLLYYAKGSQFDVHLYRAIDWKTELVKLLVRLKGFDNPSSTLDKKFSIAAAKACLDKDITHDFTDHEADAICLASLPFLRERSQQKLRGVCAA